MSEELVFLNGDYLPLSEAKISILDRGFLFGDGIYEVIPVFNGFTLRADEHLDRLKNSLTGIDIKVDITKAQWHEIFSALIKKNGGGDCVIYLQITRGTMEKRLHSWDDSLVPNILVMCSPAVYPTQSLETSGAKAVTMDDIRWSYCHLKTINLLPNALLRQRAIEKEAIEAILIRDGLAIEGAASNLFIVKDDIIYTPPKSNNLLGGITRDLILELCTENKILFRQTNIAEDELHDADEIWITATTKEIVPITTLNQHAVGKGKPGPMWLKVLQLYQAYKQKISYNS